MSVWVSVGWMKVKGTYGILTFLILLLLTLIEGCQHDTGGVLGVGGYPSSQMLGILVICRVVLKIHLFEL